jgi:hypothetical protein
LAGLIEDCRNLSAELYHQGWLLGILYQAKVTNKALFEKKINWVLDSLLLN